MTRIKVSDLKVNDSKNCLTTLSKQQLNLLMGGRNGVSTFDLVL